MREILVLLSLFLVVECKPQKEDVFSPESIRTTMNQVAEWQLAHPKHDPRDWTNGAFYAGLFAAWETTRSEALYQAMIHTFDSLAWTPRERWYHADDMAIGQTYIDLYRLEKRPEMIRPLTDTIDVFLQRDYPAGDIRVIRWWWCDALFMAPPVWVKLGLTTGNRLYLDNCDEFFKECYDLLYDKNEHLFARDLSFVVKNDGKDRLEANGKKVFWSRGNGWIMGGLARMLEELPAAYPQRPFYENLFKEMAARIVELQQPDGLWRASLLDPAAYPGGEASGSGFYCYALAWGINRGLLDRATFLPYVKKTWIALNKCVNDEGRVGWVQPIGDNPRRNFNADSWEVYGSGAFLLAGSEVIKIVGN
jgi:rhamnogalacturonyl hydrolase YesR